MTAPEKKILGPDSLRSIFRERGKPEPISACRGKQAAVLIPLVPAEHGVEVLFEVRSAGIRQGGEICFPGGIAEEHENAGETAVRETSEELLIPESEIELLAPLHTITGPGGLLTTSFLGVIPDCRGGSSPDEVDHTFRIPLRELMNLKPEIHRAELRMHFKADFPHDLIPGGKSYPWRSIPRDYYFYRTEYGVIWGMTASLLYHFLLCCKDRENQ